MKWADQYSHERKPKIDKPLCAKLPERNEKFKPDMRRYLRSRGLNPGVAEGNGWYPSSSAGDGYARIVIPATGSSPQNMYWQARLIGENGDSKRDIRWQSPNASRGDAVIVVYGGPSKGGVVVEGPMDALAAAGAGYVGVALMGMNPPMTVFDWVATLLRGEKVKVVMDLDQPEAANYILVALADRGLRCSLVSPYPFKDLAEAPVNDRISLLTT